jgi:hypothetical protein
MQNIIHEEYDNYWIHNNIIFIKPTFNDEISKINFPLLLDDTNELLNIKLTQIFFSDYKTIVSSIRIDNYYKNFYTECNNIEDNNDKIKSKFNNLVNKLPCSLTHLTFGHNFNKSVDNLPCSIIYLIFGDNFDQPIDNLPCFLTHLDLGYSFDQPINNLPGSLTHLVLGYYFGQSIEDLPSSITDIYVLLYGYEGYTGKLSDKVKVHYID